MGYKSRNIDTQTWSSVLGVFFLSWNSSFIMFYHLKIWFGPLEISNDLTRLILWLSSRCCTPSSSASSPKWPDEHGPEAPEALGSHRIPSSIAGKIWTPETHGFFYHEIWGCPVSIFPWNKFNDWLSSKLSASNPWFAIDLLLPWRRKISRSQSSWLLSSCPFGEFARLLERPHWTAICTSEAASVDESRWLPDEVHGSPSCSRT